MDFSGGGGGLRIKETEIWEKKKAALPQEDRLFSENYFAATT